MIAGTWLNVTLSVHCLSCSVFPYMAGCALQAKDTEKWSAVYYSEYQEHNRALRLRFSVSDLFSNVFAQFSAD